MLKKHATINCACCGEPFNPTREWQKYCSKKCRLSKWINEHPRISKCPHCGKEITEQDLLVEKE